MVIPEGRAELLGTEVPTHNPLPAGINSGYGRTTSEAEPVALAPLPEKMVGTVVSPGLEGTTEPENKLTLPLAGAMRQVQMIRP